MPVEVAVAAWADRNNNYMTAADTILPQCVDLHLVRVLTVVLNKVTMHFHRLLKIEKLLISCGKNEMDPENNGSLGRQQRRRRQCRQ